MDIKIDIDDDRLFADVAPVVDRDKFSKEVERIRSAIGIKTPLSPKRILQFKEVDLLEKEAERSRLRLYLPIVFRRVIEKAALCGKISDGDYLPAYLDSKLGTFDTRGNKVDETFFIVLSPNVRDDDVLKALSEYRHQIGNESGVPNYKYINPIWKTDIKKPSVKKYREWYLARKLEVPYKDIADRETYNCPIKELHDIGKNKPKGCTCFHESTIRKGVETYKSLIEKTPTF